MEPAECVAQRLSCSLGAMQGLSGVVHIDRLFDYASLALTNEAFCRRGWVHPEARQHPEKRAGSVMSHTCKPKAYITPRVTPRSCLSICFEAMFFMHCYPDVSNLPNQWALHVERPKILYCL